MKKGLLLKVGGGFLAVALIGGHYRMENQMMLLTI